MNLSAMQMTIHTGEIREENLERDVYFRMSVWILGLMAKGWSKVPVTV